MGEGALGRNHTVQRPVLGYISSLSAQSTGQKSHCAGAHAWLKSHHLTHTACPPPQPPLHKTPKFLMAKNLANALFLGMFFKAPPKTNPQKNEVPKRLFPSAGFSMGTFPTVRLGHKQLCWARIRHGHARRSTQNPAAARALRTGPDGRT